MISQLGFFMLVSSTGLFHLLLLLIYDLYEYLCSHYYYYSWVISTTTYVTDEIELQ